METALHKRIKTFSITAMILFTLAAFAGIFSVLQKNIDMAFAISGTWTAMIMFPFISIITSYSIIHKEKKWIGKIAKYVLFIYPVVFIISMAVLINGGIAIIMIITGILFFIITIFALLHLFVFTDASRLASTIMFLVLLTICILLKRFHILYSGAMFSAILLLFLLGNIMYGIRCLYIGEKNTFLRFTGFLGSWFIALSLLGMMFKMQQWPGGSLLVNSSNLIFVIGSLFILLRLPSSGYINWKESHKKILRRLILPWMLIFTLFLMRYLLPEVNSIVWSSKNVVKPQDIINGFGMVDYEIEKKNGLNK